MFLPRPHVCMWQSFLTFGTEAWHKRTQENVKLLHAGEEVGGMFLLVFHIPPSFSLSLTLSCFLSLSLSHTLTHSPSHSYSIEIGCCLPIVSSRWCPLRMKLLTFFVAHDLVLPAWLHCMGPWLHVFTQSWQHACAMKSPVIVPVTALLVLQSDPCWNLVWNVIYLWHAAPSTWNRSFCLLTCLHYWTAEHWLSTMPVEGTVVGASVHPSSVCLQTILILFYVCWFFFLTHSPPPDRFLVE